MPTAKNLDPLEHRVSWVEAEQKAQVLRNWEPNVVPDLLQTAAYAREVLRVGQPGAGDERIEELVSARLERQKVLDRDAPLFLQVVIHEHVLHRRVGAPDVMQCQLHHLTDAALRPNLTIQVVPLSAALQAGGFGAFAIADFADGVHDVVYLENPHAGHVMNRPEDVRTIINIWEAIRVGALPGPASLELIATVAEQWI